MQCYDGGGVGDGSNGDVVSGSRALIVSWINFNLHADIESGLNGNVTRILLSIYLYISMEVFKIFSHFLEKCNVKTRGEARQSNQLGFSASICCSHRCRGLSSVATIFSLSIWLTSIAQFSFVLHMYSDRLWMYVTRNACTNVRNIVANKCGHCHIKSNWRASNTPRLSCLVSCNTHSLTQSHAERIAHRCQDSEYGAEPWNVAAH